MKTKPLRLLQKRLLTPLLILPGILLTSGCQSYYHSTTQSIEKWALDEFNTYHERKPNPKKFTSTNPQDFIHADGWATAIPSASAWDLYTSPYAPDKFVRSKEPAGTAVLCPYTGKPLILGDRRQINDVDPR
jgi:hypothetical protein